MYPFPTGFKFDLLIVVHGEESNYHGIPTGELNVNGDGCELGGGNTRCKQEQVIWQEDPLFKSILFPVCPTFHMSSCLMYLCPEEVCDFSRSTSLWKQKRPSFITSAVAYPGFHNGGGGGGGGGEGGHTITGLTG